MRQKSSGMRRKIDDPISCFCRKERCIPFYHPLILLQVSFYVSQGKVANPTSPPCDLLYRPVRPQSRLAFGRGPKAKPPDISCILPSLSPVLLLVRKINPSVTPLCICLSDETSYALHQCSAPPGQSRSYAQRRRCSFDTDRGGRRIRPG